MQLKNAHKKPLFPFIFGIFQAFLLCKKPFFSGIISIRKEVKNSGPECEGYPAQRA